MRFPKTMACVVITSLYILSLNISYFEMIWKKLDCRGHYISLYVYFTE